MVSELSIFFLVFTPPPPPPHTHTHTPTPGWSLCGRYASYWNAFLLVKSSAQFRKKKSRTEVSVI